MPKLKVVEFQTVSYCNSACLVCPWKDIKKDYKMEFMTDNVFQKLLSDLAEIKPSRIIPYLNNEPLLDNDLFRKIAMVKKNTPNITMEISTNGSLMNDDIINELIKSPIDDILISVFGHDTESEHRLMHKSIDYDTVIKNILSLKNADDLANANKNIAVVKIVNSPYLDNSDIEKNIKFFKDNGITVYEYGYLNRSNNVGEYIERDAKKEPKGCELNRHNERVYIDIAGNVYFCCHDWRKKYLMGNIMESSIKKIWESDYYKEIREMVNGKLPTDTDFLCRHCKLCGEK